jgi:hypothetical protein
LRHRAAILVACQDNALKIDRESRSCFLDRFANGAVCNIRRSWTIVPVKTMARRVSGLVPTYSYADVVPEAQVWHDLIDLMLIEA